VWDTARHATEIERTLAALDPDRVTDEYKRAKRAGGDPELESALAQRFTSVQRLLNTLDDTDDRLRLLDARLGAAVAHAAEVALELPGTGPGAADALDTELAGVVDELGALRSALDELG
jgi:transposase